MAKKSTGLLLLSVLFLSACGGNPAGSSSSASSSGSLLPSDSTSSSSNAVLKDWTNEDKALVKEKFGEGVIEAIPFYAPASYTFAYDAEYECFSYVAVSLTEQSAITDYQALLAKKNYDIQIDEEGSLSAFGYYNTNGDGLHFDAYLLDEKGGFEIDIYQHTYVAPVNPRNAWTAAEIALFDQYFYVGAANVIPCSAWGEMVLTDGMSSTQNLYLFDYHGGTKEVLAYLDALEKASFVYNADNGDYELEVADKGTIYADAFVSNFGDLYFTYSFQKAITGNVTWTSTSITGITYASTSATLEGIATTISGIQVGTTGGATIQMRSLPKGGSSIENNDALPPLASITVDQYLKGDAYDGTLTISAGTSKDALKEITPVNHVYTLDGATYFKIENKSGFACYIKSFVLAFVGK